jgi:hypothetical protein
MGPEAMAGGDMMMGGGMQAGQVFGMSAGPVMAAGTGGMARRLGGGVVLMSGSPYEAAHVHVGGIMGPVVAVVGPVVHGPIVHTPIVHHQAEVYMVLVYEQ